MSGQILKFDASAHRAADALLPWYVNGTLEGDELAAVEKHVRECARCGREIEVLRQLQAACTLYEPLPDATAAHRRLAARLGAPRRRDVLWLKLRGWLAPWRRAPRWARYAIVAEFAALVSLVAWVGAPAVQPAATYQTLGATPIRAANAGSIAVVFAPAMTESELRRIVQAAGARVVDGPTQANAYVLDVPAGRRDQALATLRSEPAVVLAQPLTQR